MFHTHACIVFLPKWDNSCDLRVSLTKRHEQRASCVKWDQTDNGELPTFTPRTLVVLSWRLSLDDYLCHWGSRCIVVDVCMSGCKYACISCMYMLVCTKSIKEGMCKCLTIVFVYLYRFIHFTLMTNADNNKQWNFYIHWPVSCLRYSL